MNKDNTPDNNLQRWAWLIEKAKSQEDLLEGDYLVVVLEPDNRITRKKFSDLKNARAYADDAASENDPDNPIAIVLDSGFNLVHEGRPYYARPAAQGPIEKDAAQRHIRRAEQTKKSEESNTDKIIFQED